MLYSLVLDNNAAYLTLHAEEVLHMVNYCSFSSYNDYIPESTISLWERAKHISFSVFEEIKNWLEKIPIKQVTISCRHINQYISYDGSIIPALRSIYSLCQEKDILLSYIDVANSFESMLISSHGLTETQYIKEHIKTRDCFCIVLNNKTETKNLRRFCTTLIDQYNAAIVFHIEKCIMNATEEKSKNESSPAIILSKYINVKTLFEANKIAYFLIYLLISAILSKQIFGNLSCGKTRLMFYTLNGCAISSIVAEILNVELTCIDHLGPIYRHFRLPTDSIIEGEEYLLVADVICIGSEVARAKCLVEAFGGKIVGWISLVDVGIFRDDNKAHFSLYNVKDSGNKIGYTIQTALCEGCDCYDEN